MRPRISMRLQILPMLVIGLALAFAAHPSWFRASEGRLSLAALSIGPDEYTRGQILDRERANANQTRVIREALISDLIADRASLDEVTTRFLALNEHQPDFLALLRMKFPGSSDRENVARVVITYAQHRVDANNAERVNRQLESEFSRLSQSDMPTTN